MNAVLSNLRLALTGLLRQLEPLPPHGTARAELAAEADVLRELLRRLERLPA